MVQVDTSNKYLHDLQDGKPVVFATKILADVEQQ